MLCFPQLQLGWLTRGVDPGSWEVLTHKICRKGQNMFDPLKCHILDVYFTRSSSTKYSRNSQGHRSWVWGSWSPENMWEGSEYVLTPENVTFFHSKLLLYNCKFHSINDEQLDTINSLILLMVTMLPSLCLISSNQTVSSINAFTAILGFKLSWPKTKLQNVGAGDPPSTILIDGVPVEGVEEFIYLKKGSNGYCRPDVLHRIGLACSVMNSLQRVWNCSSLSISTKVHLYQAADKVCSALRYRNIYPLGRRHEYTVGFPHEVSATDIWCMLVGSCLECRGASAIWFVNHWWHFTSSTLISVCPRCTPGPWSTSTWCSASDGWYYEDRKNSWRRPAGRPRNVWLTKVQEDANALLLSTLWRSEIARGHGAERLSLGLREDNDDDDDDDDEDDDDEWLVSRMEGKTNFSRHLPAVRNRHCWMFENHRRISIGCNLKQFDVEADRKCIVNFRP